MANYRQYCPVALASEVLAERWNPLIVRNLMFGADTFSAIANGVPSMSRSMLIKRLDELQRAGVIETQLKPDGRGYNYRLTHAGADFAGVIRALGTWGERWADVTSEQSDPAYALWAWCQVQLNRANLPDGRMLIAFTFREERPSNRILVFARFAEYRYETFQRRTTVTPLNIGHERETNPGGHHVRRHASSQFSVQRLDTEFENVHAGGVEVQFPLSSRL
jgi:DNA-binding HxlR family transcriptional regulator